MKYNKLVVFLVLSSMLFSGCKKDHYDVSHVHGMNAEGELLLPVASKSFTIGDMIERFELMDLVNWSESGDLSFAFDWENKNVVDGEKLLKFKDLNFEESFTFENPYPMTPSPYVDTTVSIEKTITFESENIHVMRAQMKSGRLDFKISSNFGNVMHIVFRSSNIKDAAGHDLELDIPVQANAFSVRLGGMYYETDIANTLNFSIDIEVNVQSTTDPELLVDINIEGRDLAFSEMQGYVDAYSSRSRIDSVFTLFPNNVEGMLAVKGVRMKVSGRNTFALGAQFVVDTALVYSEGMPPYSILEPLPLTIDLPSQMQFSQVFEKTFGGKINASGGRAFASSNFIVNPVGTSELVTVTDTSHIDTRIDVEIPFSFNLEDVSYLDTVNLDLANLELPEMLEKLTLELNFSSTLPLDLMASFYLYDSKNDRITDTLLSNADMIEASFDGQPKTTEVALVIDEDRLGNALQSDRIIMSYRLDTGAHDVSLNVRQKLDLFLKVRAKYKADVNLDNLD